MLADDKFSQVRLNVEQIMVHQTALYDEHLTGAIKQIESMDLNQASKVFAVEAVRKIATAHLKEFEDKLIALNATGLRISNEPLH